MEEALAIERARQTGQGEQRLQLRGEGEAAAGDRVVKRLDAEAVAREKQGAGRAVVKAEGEHAIEPRQSCLAVANEQAKQ